MTAGEFQRLLKASNMKPLHLARELGVGRSTLYRWLTGETPITHVAAIAIRSILKK